MCNVLTTFNASVAYAEAVHGGFAGAHFNYGLAGQFLEMSIRDHTIFVSILPRTIYTFDLHARRQTLRTSDGHLSPAAFSPVSQAAEAAAASLQAAGLTSVQLHGWPKPVACRIWEQTVAAGGSPA